jgi:phosphatidylglycerophosphatase A
VPILERLKLAIVSCGFLGCAPVMPGTFGTLGGVLFAYLMRGAEPFWAWCLGLALVIYLITRTMGEWAEQYAGKKDPGIFVQDEVVGYLVTVAWIGEPTILSLACAFFVFRLFDIWKPFPCRILEKVGKGEASCARPGDGILLDDVMAGIYGFAVMALLRTYLLEPSSWVVQ